MTVIAPIESTPFGLSEATRSLDAVSGSAGTTSAASAIDSFGAFLGSAVEAANRADLTASQKVDALASGAADDLHGTMISVKEAEISIKLVGTVRNKILDAFQELWRTSV
jgi:flagellar hook-basal body complex protein FliE